MVPATHLGFEDAVFLELRRKVRESELLSAAVEKLLLNAHFSGRISIVIQNGRVLKSGYEEGYFSNRNDMQQAEDGRPVPQKRCQPVR